MRSKLTIERKRIGNFGSLTNKREKRNKELWESIIGKREGEMDEKLAIVKKKKGDSCGGNLFLFLLIGPCL